MSKSLTSAILFCLSLSIGSVAIAEDTGPLQSTENSAHSDAMSLTTAALAKQRQMQNRLDFLLAPIKSRDDLAQYLATTPKAQSPLELLSPGAKQRLLASLFFNENGLVSYDYTDLVNELSASQIYRVLGLFGVQRTTGLLKDIRVSSEADRLIVPLKIFHTDPGMEGDHGGYRCVGAHNCIEHRGMICMMGC